jgi:predicted secreted protein
VNRKSTTVPGAMAIDGHADHKVDAPEIVEDGEEVS